MILSFSKKMIPNTGIRVCYTLDFHTITDFGANEEGLPLMILSDHFETAPGRNDIPFAESIRR